MADERDSIHYEQLARDARQLAERQSDPVLARTLREKAIKHDRLARKLKRMETAKATTSPKPLGILYRLFGR